MAQLSESVSASDEGFAGCYRVPDHLEAGHRDGHSELNRKTNALEVQVPPEGYGPSVIVGHSSNAIASDLGSCIVFGGGQETGNWQNVIGGDGSLSINDPDTENVTAVDTGAHYSTIVGGYDNMIGGTACTVAGTHNYTGLDVTHSVIAGGALNIIKNTDGFDTEYGTIAGGRENIVDADYGTISGGRDNVVNSQSYYSVIPGGQDNQVATTVTHATALGHEAKASQQAGVTIAGGKFSAVGDAQSTVLIVKGQTTDENPINLVANGTSWVTIPTDTTWMFRVSVVARRTDADGESAAYENIGCLDNNAGTVALVGSVSQTVVAEDTSAWVFANAADNTNKALANYCYGESGKTINWVARIELTEVTG